MRHLKLTRAISIAALLALFGFASQTPRAATPAGAVAVPAQGAALDAGCPALLQQSFLRLQDEKPQSFCQYAGIVVVAVNMAASADSRHGTGAWSVLGNGPEPDCAWPSV